MGLLESFIGGPLGAILMAVFGGAAICLALAIPLLIMNDPKLLFGRRVYNVSFGIISLFFRNGTKQKLSFFKK